MRDPRLKPQVGDVLMVCGRKSRRVAEVTGEFDYSSVFYHSIGGRGHMYLINWRKWAKDAEVLKVAE